MTMKRYGRLFLVLALPLLLAGFLFAKVVAPYGLGPFILCEEWNVNAPEEFCRDVGWEGHPHDYFISQQPAWFDLKLPDAEMDGPLFSYVQASQRRFMNARIIAAQPFSGSMPEEAEIMAKLSGQDADIVLVCAAGGQAALAGKTLKDMGYRNVCNVGGIADWIAAGGKSEA